MCSVAISSISVVASLALAGARSVAHAARPNDGAGSTAVTGLAAPSLSSLVDMMPNYRYERADGKRADGKRVRTMSWRVGTQQPLRASS